jgi:hypothetical protein
MTKAYHETVSVLEALAKQGVLTYDVIERVSNQECLSRKQRAHVVIDEVVTGNFHRSSLESLAQGAVVLAHLPPIAVRRMGQFLEPAAIETWPWIDTHLSTLERTLRELADDPERVAQLRTRSRQWMERYWDDRDLVRNNFVEVYKSVISGSTRRPGTPNGG